MPRQMMTVAARDIKSRKTLGIPLNATAMEILRGQIGKHAEYVFVYKGRPLNATVNTPEHLAPHAAVMDELLLCSNGKTPL